MFIRKKDYRELVEHIKSLQNRNAALLDQLYLVRRAKDDVFVKLSATMTNAVEAMLEKYMEENK